MSKATTVLTPGEPVTLPPAGNISFEIEKGQRLKMTQPEGEQVADLISFNRDDPRELLSMLRSRAVNLNWTLLLDEPTNHLDADSLGWLREFLRAHTRRFRSVTNSERELGEPARARKLAGNWTSSSRRERSCLPRRRRREAAGRHWRGGTRRSNRRQPCWRGA